MRTERLTSDIEPTAEAFARAFLDDAVFVELFPDPAARAAGLKAISRVYLRLGQALGEVQVLAGRPGAAAVWFSPGACSPTKEQLAAAGYYALPDQIGESAFAAFDRFFRELDALHRREAGEPHWHLAVIGVDPQLQGSGLGSVLIQAMLTRTDRQGLPVYMLTLQPGDVPLYQRHGFDLLTGGAGAAGGAKVWTLLRKPHGGDHIDRLLRLSNGVSARLANADAAY